MVRGAATPAAGRAGQAASRPHMPNVRSQARQAAGTALARGNPTLDAELPAKLRGRL